MMSRPSITLWVLLTAAICSTAGCSDSAQDKAAKILANRKKGGYIRLVNLADVPVRLMFGPRQLTQAQPGIGTPYSLYSPGSHDAQLMVGSPEKAVPIRLEIVSEQATAIYLLDKSGKTAIVVGDEIRAPEGSSSVRLVNLTGQTAELSLGATGALSADTGEGSETKAVASGDQNWTGAGGVPIRLDLEAGAAYVVVAYSKAGKPDYLVLKSSRRQEIQAQGASAAG